MDPELCRQKTVSGEGDEEINRKNTMLLKQRKATQARQIRFKKFDNLNLITLL